MSSLWSTMYYVWEQGHNSTHNTNHVVHTIFKLSYLFLVYIYVYMHIYIYISVFSFRVLPFMLLIYFTLQKHINVCLTNPKSVFIYLFILIVKSRKGRFGQCGIIGKKDKEIQRLL